jgi:hypothetical protein
MATTQREEIRTQAIQGTYGTEGTQGAYGTAGAGVGGVAAGGYGRVVLTIKSAHNLRDKAWIGKTGKNKLIFHNIFNSFLTFQKYFQPQIPMSK